MALAALLKFFPEDGSPYKFPSTCSDTNDEFVSRLDSVLGRFRKHNLFLEASKCSFGFKELELVRSRGKSIPTKNPSRPRFSITYRRQTTEEFFGYGCSLIPYYMYMYIMYMYIYIYIYTLYGIQDPRP